MPDHSLRSSSWNRSQLESKRLGTGPNPELASDLYLYLTQKEEFTSSAKRQALVRRIREALIKCVSIVGCCKPIECIIAISQVEQEPDKDYTMTREKWQCDAQNHENATRWFRSVYGRDERSTLSLFDAHKDFQWLSTEITYGLYLSDRTVLNDVETEIVVPASIMIQNLKIEPHWHSRGARRVGISKHDTEVFWSCIQEVARYFRLDLPRVPTVAEVEPDV
ncbi:uncharacterized protein BO97DRAFT_430817 [Aspergillus homomorphus CBS 101889]|uniref:Uncharacterized protein n=1 Tax=Aspergillus homomorphus (strain CBS 101889) TaxID=1450537 RepID=A0A395ICA7_ASPHC|nr:hypothetical protein BO97DRAFT_430817 [Aspergillus homomorphus CBS 101889]RAL16738.1 hypothetical protein BO97DRAFT_430817 [Aspergillus homomorphus CBS 101889]